MGEPAKQSFNAINLEEEAFHAYLKSIKGTGRPLLNLMGTEDHLAFLDNFFTEVNAIHDEPLDGMLLRIPFRGEINA